MRLFVAVNLPDQQKRQLGRLLENLRGETPDVRWVNSESLHLTLKFLGEVADQHVDVVQAALTRAASGVRSFDIRVAGFGTFPSRTRARVFWIGVDAPEELYRLQENVEREIAPLGFPTEKRKFQAHITLGRVPGNGQLDARVVDRIAPHVGYNATTRVDTVDLMRSHLSPRGARYELLYAAPFGKP